MNQRLQDDAVISELNSEAEVYVSQSDFAGCMERMKWYEKNYDSPNIRYAAYITHARCALELGDLAEARAAVDSIEWDNSEVLYGIYVDLMLIQILERGRDFESAKKLLRENLEKPEIRQPENSEAYHQFLGYTVIVLSELGEYREALAYVDKGEDGFEPGRFRDTVMVRKARCLEMLGEYQAAEACLLRLLSIGSGELTVNIYYELAILHWKRGWAEEAQSMLEFAKQSLPHGTITATEIDEAQAKLRAQVAMRSAEDAMSTQKYPIQ